MSTDENATLQSLVEQHASALAEHFDSVRIFCTRNTEDGQQNTIGVESGRGNFYAQLGQIHEWLCIQEQYQRNWAVKKDNEKGE